MRVQFRQGIISYQSSGFLSVNGSGNVDIDAINRPVTVTIAHKDTDYIHSEDTTYTDAWIGPFAPATRYWLYWEFDPLTFERTFGFTTLEPIAQNTAPVNGVDSYGVDIMTAGRMWFNTLTGEHFELMTSYTQNWRSVIRVFSAQLYNGVFISQSINGPSDFSGTQVGLTQPIFAGRPLFNEAGNPIKTDDNLFFTTESQFFTRQSRVDALRLESNVTRAQCSETAMAEFHIVAWESDGRIKTADYDDTGNTILGVLTEPLLLDEVGAVITQGTVRNPAWNFTNIGQELWVDNGVLLENDPHVTDSITYNVGRVPVARVLSNDTIIFEQGLGGKGEKGDPGTVTNLPDASDTVKGVVNILPGASTTVVSVDDPLYTGGPYSVVGHGHAASEITFTPGGGLTSSQVQAALVELGNTKVDLAGDTMTGFLTLPSVDPTADYHAATKKYVDDNLLKPYDILFQALGTTADGIIIGRFKAVRDFTLQANGHEGYADTAPSGGGPATFTVFRDPAAAGSPVSVGTLVFNNGSNNLSSESIVETSFAAGDLMILELTVSNLIEDLTITLAALAD